MSSIEILAQIKVYEEIVAESTGPGNMVSQWSYQEITAGRYHGGFGAYDMSRFYE